MSLRFFVLACVILAFGLLTTLALLEVGYVGLIAMHLQSWGGAQVLVDLVIVSLLACIWMVRDARERGLSAWPFVAITVVAGSFGPLCYLVVRELRSTDERPAKASAIA
jgi:uncharacterized membrane protein YqjE